VSDSLKERLIRIRSGRAGSRADNQRTRSEAKAGSLPPESRDAGEGRSRADDRTRREPGTTGMEGRSRPADEGLRELGFLPIGELVYCRVTSATSSAGGDTERIAGDTVGETSSEPGTAGERGVAGCDQSFTGEIAQLSARGSMLAGCTAEQLVFLDTETTGLSGGAGTFLFLVGLGRIVEQEIRIEQLLLADYPGEPEFLELLRDRFRPDDVIVSYNGRSFDLQILRQRFLMNGVAWTEPRQIDLLYPARRLWRRVLPDCRLSTLERHVLAFRRELDIPGFEVPARFFRFLDGEDPTVLSEVVAHHEHDVRTLARLLNQVECRLEAPDCLAVGNAHSEGGRGETSAGSGNGGDPAPGGTATSMDSQGAPIDPVGLARLLYDLNRAEDAVAVLERSADYDEPIGYARRSMQLLARHYRREGRYEEAREIWESLYRRGGSLRAGVELAKHLEHRKRDYDGALSVCTAILERAEAVHLREEVRYRAARLRRKLHASSPEIALTRAGLATPPTAP